MMLEIKIFQVCWGNNILDLVKKNNTLKQLYFSGTCGILTVSSQSLIQVIWISGNIIPYDAWMVIKVFDVKWVTVKHISCRCAKNDAIFDQTLQIQFFVQTRIVTSYWKVVHTTDICFPILLTLSTILSTSKICSWQNKM